MGIVIRDSNKVRRMKSLDGKYYYMSKNAYGFSEQYIFFDKEGKELERFTPNASYSEIVGFYELEDVVGFDGTIINAEFTYSEFDEQS